MILTRESRIRESRWIQKISNGDRGAFNQLVLQYQDLAYSHAYALLGNHADAEDATQESFIKAFQCFSQFRGEAFRPWLLKIVTNTCYDEMRRGKRRPVPVPLEPEDEYGEENDTPFWLTDPRPLVHSTVEQRELFDSIFQIIDDLAEEYRAAITLVDLHQLDYAEAAQILGVRLGTLKSRVARARFQVKRKMQANPESALNFCPERSRSGCFLVYKKALVEPCS